MKEIEDQNETAVTIMKTRSVGVSEVNLATLSPAELAVLAAGLPPRVESSAEDIAARLAARRSRVADDARDFGQSTDATAHHATNNPSPADRLLGFQDRVAAAHHALFHDDPTDIEERLARFFEEVNETCQALGMNREDAHKLVDYTYDRPTGIPSKEIGAAMLTLTSLCVVAGYDLMSCAENDLHKLQTPETIERIRAKRASRHGRGPLPGLDPAVRIVFGLEAQGHIPTVEAMLAKGQDWQDIGRCIGWDGETARKYYERHLARAALKSEGSAE